MSEVLWRVLAWLATRPAVSDWLIARAMRTPHSEIRGDDGSLYMGRWWLFNPYPRTDGAHLRRYPWLPISVRIHHIVRPDSDRALHDHPWNARTIILRGWYVERREGQGYFKRNEGDTASLRFGEFHRITSLSAGGAYTLFITGRYRGTWGFKVHGVKVPWREHLGV